LGQKKREDQMILTWKFCSKTQGKKTKRSLPSIIGATGSGRERSHGN